MAEEAFVVAVDVTGDSKHEIDNDYIRDSRTTHKCILKVAKSCKISTIDTIAVQFVL